MNGKPTIRTRYFTSLGTSIATGLCCSFVLVACQGPKEKVVSAKENVTEAKEQVTDARQELKEAKREVRAEWQATWVKFKRDNDTDVADNERRIIVLRREVGDLPTGQRAGYTTRIDGFERQNYALRDRVNNVRDEGDVAWEQFKTDMSRDMKDLKHSLKTLTIKHT